MEIASPNPLKKPGTSELNFAGVLLLTASLALPTLTLSLCKGKCSKTLGKRTNILGFSPAIDRTDQGGWGRGVAPKT